MEQLDEVPFRFLRKITDDFSEERKVGQGAFGTVYRGVTTDGYDVAVKIFREDISDLDHRQFTNEFYNLMTVKHKNIVRVLGYCYDTKKTHIEYDGKTVLAEETQKALCLEYLNNGSLQNHLSDESCGLEWDMWYKIIKGICEGLKYLHKDRGESLLHLDLKPGNILLDENKVPKIADFGLSKIFDDERTRITQSHLGTPGFTPPEFIDRGEISEKFDIFSLGAIIIRILSGPDGRKNIMMRLLNLLVLRNWRNRWDIYSHGFLLKAWSRQVETCTQIALNCLEDDSQKRPDIVKIIEKLSELEVINNKVINLQDPEERNKTLSEIIKHSETKPTNEYKVMTTDQHQLSEVTFQFLREITNDFSEERKVGEGAFGRVYRGVHKDGEKIAVKMLYYMPGLDKEQFVNEFNNFARLQHPNIVRLVGYCHETRRECIEHKGRVVFADRIHMALCFEYIHSGSLDKHLSDEYNGLDWDVRYTLIKGICKGLKYLHEELRPPIYHLDLKPANILIDENMLPKIADFGLSRFFADNHSQITRSSIGTLGYLPPEYIERNVISDKFDIFSLGVVIIKIVTGPTGYNISAEMPPQEFVELAHKNWMERLHAAPMHLLESYSKQVKKCMEIALSSVVADRHKRPSIGEIVRELDDDTETDDSQILTTSS